MRLSLRRSARPVVATAAAALAVTGTAVVLALPASATPAKAPVKASAKAPVTCTGADVKVTAQIRAHRHLLLTATNTGTRECSLYGFPGLRFDQDQAAVPEIAASVPQAVIELKHGQHAYADVHTSTAGGSHGRTAHTLAVYFFGRSLSGSVGTAARTVLPKTGVHIDDTAETTYWEATKALALKW